MALTAEQLNLLKRPFAAHEHEFLNGNAYITEAAITTRLDEVDPSWSMECTSVTTRERQAVVVCRLVLCDVARTGVGMSQIVSTKDGSKEANEAEKSAATDALKRAARLFGIGRYLLLLPDGVKDTASMDRWLNQSGKHHPAPQVNKPAAPNGEWGAEAWETVKAEGRKRGMEPAAVLALLKIDKPNEWRQGLAAALAAVNATEPVAF